MKRLPVGIQTFSEIIEKDYLYIDKSKEALQLIEGHKYAFLSRPRRFGKSLFLDTLHNIFEGKRELFKGLYIYDRYDFEAYPVIKIEWRRDMSSLEKLERVALIYCSKTKRDSEYLAKKHKVQMDASRSSYKEPTRSIKNP